MERRLNIKSPGPRPIMYLPTKWHLNPSSRLATIDIYRKLGGLCPFWGELGPHLTQYGRTEAYCMPSFILVRPTNGRPKIMLCEEKWWNGHYSSSSSSLLLPCSRI